MTLGLRFPARFGKAPWAKLSATQRIIEAEILVTKWLLDLAPACAIAFITDRLVDCVVADVACLIYQRPLKRCCDIY
jgi:hypothetical protein